MMKKIFVVDDDADDRQLFQEALEEIAPTFTCYTAYNGSHALQSMENQDIELPDLIFLDVNMPSINGWQFLEAVKGIQAFRDIPIIMYSTCSHPEYITRALEMGALYFYAKPCDFNDLRNNLKIVMTHLINSTLHELHIDAPAFMVSPG
jgi:CheY-like chemotaxis protein